MCTLWNERLLQKEFNTRRAHVYRWENMSNSLSYVFQIRNVWSTPHTESEPKCLSNGHPFHQLPWTIRFYFLSIIFLSFHPSTVTGHFQALPCQVLARANTLHLPLCRRALGLKDQLVKWVPELCNTRCSHGPQTS